MKKARPPFQISRLRANVGAFASTHLGSVARGVPHHEDDDVFQEAFARRMQQDPVGMRAQIEACTADLNDAETQMTLATSIRKSAASYTGSVRKRLHNSPHFTSLTAKPGETFDVPASGDEFEASEYAEHLELRVARALSELPCKQKEAIHLRFFRGFTLKEIASAIGCSDAAARKSLSRAYETLAVLLADMRPVQTA